MKLHLLTILSGYTALVGPPPIALPQGPHQPKSGLEFFDVKRGVRLDEIHTDIKFEYLFIHFSKQNEFHKIKITTHPI